MAKIPPVTLKFYVATPPTKVYAALTRPRQLVKWFLAEADITAKPRTPFQFTWRGGYTMKGKVRDVVPNRRVTLDWIDRFDGGKVFETRAEFVLRRKGRGTILTIRHSGFKSGKKWVSLYGAIHAGWTYYLLNLKSVLEHGTDLRSDLDSVA
jgi:uncharacterized protein YndB with AHSA1/START domain